MKKYPFPHETIEIIHLKPRSQLAILKYPLLKWKCKRAGGQKEAFTILLPAFLVYLFAARKENGARFHLFNCSSVLTRNSTFISSSNLRMHQENDAPVAVSKVAKSHISTGWQNISTKNLTNRLNRWSLQVLAQIVAQVNLTSAGHIYGPCIWCFHLSVGRAAWDKAPFAFVRQIHSKSPNMTNAAAEGGREERQTLHIVRQKPIHVFIISWQRRTFILRRNIFCLADSLDNCTKLV